MPLGTRAAMASQIARNALAKGIWEASGDIGSGRAAWACKTGLGYAVAMRRLCGRGGIENICSRRLQPEHEPTRQGPEIPNPLASLLDLFTPIRDPKILGRADTPPRVLDYHISQEPYPLSLDQRSLTLISQNEHS